MSMTKLYVELEQDYGTDLVHRAMDYVRTLPGDDGWTPSDRYDRVAAWLRGYSREPQLSAFLAEVEQSLTGDCGDHRPMLERLRDRLKTALAGMAMHATADIPAIDE